MVISEANQPRVTKPETLPLNKDPIGSWLSGRVFLALIGAALMVTFPRVLFGTYTFFDRDFGAICYAQAFYQRDSFLRGEIPFWNPYNYCGIPFMSQWSGGWYPTCFLNAVFPVPWSVNFFHLMHLVWGACGMYWLVRRWGCAGFAAAFAGFAYVFNGVTLSCLMWPGYTGFLAWSPWVLGCTMAAWRHGGRWIPLAACASAMQVLACAPELTVLFWGLVGVLLLAEIANGEVRFLPSLVRLSGALMLAAGITMVQMLPFLDLLAHSQRDANYGGTKWAMPGWGWANLLVPLFHCFRSPRGCWYQPNQQLVCSYYLGAGVLVLAAAGLWLRRTKECAIFAGMALFCWIMALGSNGVLFDWVKRVFPWIGIARYPVKLALFPVLLMPLLAARAIDDIAERPAKRKDRVLIVLGSAILSLMLGLVWFANKFPFQWDDRHATVVNAVGRALLAIGLLGGVLCAARIESNAARAGLQTAILSLLILDAFTHNPLLMPTLPASSLAPGMWAAGNKQPPPVLGEGRAMTTPQASVQLGFGHFSDGVVEFTGKRLGEIQDLNLLDRVPMVGGGMILFPEHFAKLERFLYNTPGLCWGNGLLDFLSVQYISSTENPILWTARTNWLPVITAGQRPSFAGDDEVLHSMTADGFEPREIVYLHPSARSLVSVTNRTDCKILRARFSPQEVDAEVNAAEASLVVLSQSFYHLWRASVDGRTAPLLRANLAFQAIQIPAGRHRVTLRYVDNYFRLGLVITTISLILCGLVWLAASTARRPVAVCSSDGVREEQPSRILASGQRPRRVVSERPNAIFPHARKPA